MRLSRLKPEQLGNNVGYNQWYSWSLLQCTSTYCSKVWGRLKNKTATRNTRMYLISKLPNK